MIDSYKQTLATAVFGLWITGCGGDDQTHVDVDAMAASCGDHVCSASESNATCPVDCPATATCGDGTCSGTETPASCPQDCPVCGDGVCNGTETSASCPQDCTAASCTTFPDDCTGENVCVQGSCVAAFGRIYKMFIFDGTMTQDDETGTPWDAVGGLPDPYVIINLNGAFLGQTNTRNDTLTPAWSEAATATIAGGSTFDIQVFDEDVAVDDLMFSCTTQPLTADLLRHHGPPYGTCAGTGPLAAANVRFYFVPQ